MTYDETSSTVTLTSGRPPRSGRPNGLSCPASQCPKLPFPPPEGPAIALPDGPPPVPLLLVWLVSDGERLCGRNRRERSGDLRQRLRGRDERAGRPYCQADGDRKVAGGQMTQSNATRLGRTH